MAFLVYGSLAVLAVIVVGLIIRILLLRAR
jgi:hypothetical protein